MLALMIQITSPSGEVFEVPCVTDPQVVMVDGKMRPGLVTGEPPEPCPFRSDYLLTAINEGGQVAGNWTTDEGEAWTWRITPSAIRTEDGFIFYLIPARMSWMDALDPDDADMECDCLSSGLPRFDPLLSYRGVDDPRHTDSQA